MEDAILLFSDDLGRLYLLLITTNIDAMSIAMTYKDDTLSDVLNHDV